MSRKRRAASYASLLTVGLFLAIPLTGVGVAGWTAEVSVSTGETYSGVPFTCSVVFWNNDVETLIVKSVTFTIKWPGGSPGPDWPDPTEHHVIFQGSQSIDPGTSFTFEKRIQSGFGGGFTTETSIVARAIWDSQDSERVFLGSINLRSPSEAPGYVDPSIILTIGVVLVSIAFFAFL